MQVADLAVEPQAVPAHRLEVRAAGHERDVVAGGGETGAEVAPHPSGPHNGDFHVRAHGVMTTRPTILPARKSSSDWLVSPSGLFSTGMGAILPALARSIISRASTV